MNFVAPANIGDRILVERQIPQGSRRDGPYTMEDGTVIGNCYSYWMEDHSFLDERDFTPEQIQEHR